MRAKHFVISCLVAASLAGCATKEEPGFAMRNAGGIASEQDLMDGQALALQKMTQDILRKSTAQGAALGALAGCSLVVLSAANAQNCIGGAAVGAIAGAAVGHAAGEKQVAKRVRIVSPSALVRSIGKTNETVDQIQMSLPSLLAAQDIELAELSDKVSKGEMTEAMYAQRAEAIKAERSELAQALSISAAQAQIAHENLLVAQSHGQTGLDWHLTATSNLAREVMSARATIDLLG